MRIEPRPAGDRPIVPGHDAPIGGNTKRSMDIIVATIALIGLLPVMLVFAALIKATSKGPIFYAHPRVGYGGRSFPCYKFRSMVLDGDAVLKKYLEANPAAAREWLDNRKLAHDPRITPLGHIMRKSSIDELPQLFNVLLGDMSCIGPRPVVGAEMARYGEYAADYIKARPGVTGIWQVSGRSSTSYEKRIQLDHFYVRRWSVWLDASILLRTVPCVLRFRDSA